MKILVLSKFRLFLLIWNGSFDRNTFLGKRGVYFVSDVLEISGIKKK